MFDYQAGALQKIDLDFILKVNQLLGCITSCWTHLKFDFEDESTSWLFHQLLDPPHLILAEWGRLIDAFPESPLIYNRGQKNTNTPKILCWLKTYKSLVFSEEALLTILNNTFIPQPGAPYIYPLSPPQICTHPVFDVILLLAPSLACTCLIYVSESGWGESPWWIQIPWLQLFSQPQIRQPSI